jgi:hydrogenase maturation protein HypF
VGFRPFLFGLAERYAISGTVQNNMDGIRLEAEGAVPALQELLAAIRREAPRLARVDEIRAVPLAVEGRLGFHIVESSREGASSLVIPVDAGICPDCLAELKDPANRRYRYPFITCTQCGPRYTIIRELPYDRPYTSMSGFPMCPACREEYGDVTDRRHHAQPIACPECGPRLALYAMDEAPKEPLGRAGAKAAEPAAQPVSGSAAGAGSAAQGKAGAGAQGVRRPLAEADEAVRRCAELLRQGAIVAVKGIGGYHLACDAASEAAVARLRQRKRRPTRPLAVMAADAETACRAAVLSSQELRLLHSPEAPIVIARKAVAWPLADSVAPGMATVGLMLPYTPLHVLLMEELPFLVMTSANPSGQPILYRDEEAFDYLAGIADYVLAHDREILHPLDDSVVQVVEGQTDILRRSRGYAPDPLTAPVDVTGWAALGGQQKNTFALGRGKQIFFGPHIGDMDSVETQEHWKKELAHFSKLLGVEPRRTAADLHPGYETRRLSREMGREPIGVQHHHAHLVSCMADNGLSPEEEVCGIILDGTGYGPDGCIWGFEILAGSASGWRRLGHLRYTPLPGGEKAVREPWRNAAGMLVSLFPEQGPAWAAQLFPGKSMELAVLGRMAVTGMNSPWAGTCGRLFDAVSAILGLVAVSGYDGEAAIRLSELAAFADAEGANAVTPFGYAIRDRGETEALELDMSDTLRQVAEGRLAGSRTEELALRFHETAARAAVDLLQRALEKEGLSAAAIPKVMLSGGSFHNPYLARRIPALLKERGLEPYRHRQVPTGDGGLALGQLLAAAYAEASSGSRNISQAGGE